MMNKVMNPILNKELKIGSRSIRFPLAIAAYAALIGVVAWMYLYEALGGYGRAFAVEFDTFSECFLMLAYFQLFMICVIVPVLTAGSIAGERERQTLDMLLTAPVTPMGIVFGKLLAALANVLIFVFASLPAMAMCFIYGGIRWQNLLVFAVAIMVIAFFAGAVGIYCSAAYKKTIFSVVMTFLIEGIFYLLPILVVFFYAVFRFTKVVGEELFTTKVIDLGFVPLILLLCPLLGFIDVMTKICSGANVVADLVATGIYGEADAADLFVQLTAHWGLISMIITLLLGLLFVWLAARKIDETKYKNRKR